MVIPGTYFDGRQPTRWTVLVSVCDGGLRIRKEEGTVIDWPRRSFVRASGSYTDERIRFERGDEVLSVDDPALLGMLGQRRSSRRKHLAWAAAALVLALLTAYRWGLPALTRVAAARVPLAWEESLGKGVYEKLAPSPKRCTDADANAAVQAIVEHLLRNQPRNSYKVRIAIVNDPRINAFAAPGGYLVLFAGLLVRTQRSEELAGVLAHELAHVIERHPTQGLVRALSTSALVSTVAGDFGTLSSLAASLTTLRYGRSDEQTADLRGLGLMISAGVDAQGMIDMFRTLSQSEGDKMDALEFLSSHPLTEERITQLQAELGRQPRPSPEPLLPGVDWSRIRRACPLEAQ